MKRAREIEILFRRLRLYDQFGRRAEAAKSSENWRSAMGIEHVRSEIGHMRVEVGRLGIYLVLPSTLEKREDD